MIKTIGDTLKNFDNKTNDLKEINDKNKCS